MVMPNRHDGASSPEWWDDLPPEVKRRVTPPAAEVPGARGSEPTKQTRSSFRPAVIGELSRLAVVFLAVLIANILFLLIALSFIVNR